MSKVKEITPELLEKLRERRRFYFQQWKLKNPEKTKLQNKKCKLKENNPEYNEREKLRSRKNGQFKSEYLKFKKAIPWFLTN